MSSGFQILENFEEFIVYPAITLVFTAGLLVFMWGLVQFLAKLREGGDTKEGVQHMLWGIAGMFIMVSVGAIITMIINFIGSDPRQPDVGRLKGIEGAAPQLRLFGPPAD